MSTKQSNRSFLWGALKFLSIFLIPILTVFGITTVYVHLTSAPLMTFQQINNLPDGSNVWVKGHLYFISSSYKSGYPLYNNLKPIGLFVVDTRESTAVPQGLIVIYGSGTENIISKFGTKGFVIVHGTKTAWDGVHLDNWIVSESSGLPQGTCAIRIIELRSPNWYGA